MCATSSPLTSPVAVNAITITVADATSFPASGTVTIDEGLPSAETLVYTSRTSTQLLTAPAALAHNVSAMVAVVGVWARAGATPQTERGRRACRSYLMLGYLKDHPEVVASVLAFAGALLRLLDNRLKARALLAAPSEDVREKIANLPPVSGLLVLLLAAAALVSCPAGLRQVRAAARIISPRVQRRSRLRTTGQVQARCLCRPGREFQANRGALLRASSITCRETAVIKPASSTLPRWNKVPYLPILLASSSPRPVKKRCGLGCRGKTLPSGKTGWGSRSTPGFCGLTRLSRSLTPGVGRKPSPKASSYRTRP